MHLVGRASSRARFSVFQRSGLDGVSPHRSWRQCATERSWRLPVNRAPSPLPSPILGERVAEGRVRGIPGSWPQLTSNLWRCLLPMHARQSGLRSQRGDWVSPSSLPACSVSASRRSASASWPRCWRTQFTPSPRCWPFSSWAHPSVPRSINGSLCEGVQSAGRQPEFASRARSREILRRSCLPTCSWGLRWCASSVLSRLEKRKPFLKPVARRSATAALPCRRRK